MIEIEDVACSIGGKTIVDGVSFRAENGRITGLLGPNGAGKTTTLRIVAGLIRPDRGSVAIEGREVHGQGLEARSALGVLCEDPGLYPRLTALEHLLYSAQLQGLRGQDAQEAAFRVAELTGVAPLLERRTLGFSRGERQRLALARALVHDPPNLLLDEPTNGLDVAGNRALRGTIRNLARQNRCVVLCSHVMQDVAALCDEVIILKNGQVIAQGTCSDLQRQTGCPTFEETFLAILGDGKGLL